MVSIKVKFRPSGTNDREGLIYYQIIYDRKVRQIASDMHIRPDEWLDQRSTVCLGSDTTRICYINNVRDNISRDIERLHTVVAQLTDRHPCFSADDIVGSFRHYKDLYRLTNYFENIISRLKDRGKTRTSETYRATLNSIKHFLDECHHGVNDMMIDMITPSLMADYQSWLLARGTMLNTVSFYMRIMRAVYNRAVDSGAVRDRRPFRRVYTGIDKTVKRALSLPTIKKVKSLDLTDKPSLALARDMFMMSFYMRGMSFIDMAYLRKTDLRDGYIRYRRRKTGQMLIICWTKEMQDIVDRHPATHPEYLLPIIKPTAMNTRCAYRNAGYNINRSLKSIARMLGITMPLTLYVARHSWATAAKSKGIPISVISEGMGHDSETTTRIYLASIDTSVVDKANSLIISSL
ncbi:MAG: site-specific integrase [Bacteroidales bacterium]|nr:site-specific integrase [Bacteroidales bacterium]